VDKLYLGPHPSHDTPDALDASRKSAMVIVTRQRSTARTSTHLQHWRLVATLLSSPDWRLRLVAVLCHNQLASSRSITHGSAVIMFRKL
jgi:hypothetical protein